MPTVGAILAPQASLNLEGVLALNCSMPSPSHVLDIVRMVPAFGSVVRALALAVVGAEAGVLVRGDAVLRRNNPHHLGQGISQRVVARLAVAQRRVGAR